MTQNLLLFASGSGSNAVNVCRYFQHHPSVKVVGLICNNPKAGVINKMEAFGVPVVLVNRAEFNQAEVMLHLISRFDPSLICLLGFLWKIPAFLVQTYPQKIVNLHPALLPKFGGKGMYGMHVHEAVKAAGETQTGISIHWVNEHFDEGEIIAQFACEIAARDSVEDIAHKIHGLEQSHVPAVIEKVLANL
jgi:phosphoribosylglycinamide formyltransferase 1